MISMAPGQITIPNSNTARVRDPTGWFYENCCHVLPRARSPRERAQPVTGEKWQVGVLEWVREHHRPGRSVQPTSDAHL
jgi:hypothetical protein